MRISTLLLATIFTAAAPLAVAQAGTLVTNGDFSSTSPNTTVSTQFGTSYSAGQFITDWTGNNGYQLWFPNATAATTEDAVGQYTYTGQEKLWQVTASPNGGAFIGLDGDQTPGVQSSISQVINNLVAGDKYAVTFDWGAAQVQSRTGATTEQLQVSLGSSSLLTQVINNPSGGFTGWYTTTLDFTATSVSEALQFLSIGTPSGEPPMAVLDGVTMTQVPEPSTIALFGAAIVGLGLAWRRRQRANTKA